MEHRYHEYVLFTEARNIINEEMDKVFKLSKAQQENLKQAQQALCLKSEEVSSNETSLLATVDSTFKEIQSKLDIHRQNIHDQIKKKFSDEMDKIKACMEENVGIQEGLQESVSFCENILSKTSNLEIVFFLDDMKSSLLKFSNQDTTKCYVTLTRLEIDVEKELQKALLKVFHLKQDVIENKDTNTATMSSNSPKKLTRTLFLCHQTKLVLKPR